MNRTSIEYCTHTWNPVTGCRRGCHYCYAKRFHDRFNPTVPFDHITEHFARLFDPGLTAKKARRIFVGSMSDIEFWPKPFLRRVLCITYVSCQHEYLFLTKNPSVYADPVWERCGGNIMMGTTFDLAVSPPSEHICLWKNHKLNRPWLSLEPLLGPLTFSVAPYEFVAVGADSRRGAPPPRPEWIRSVMARVPAEKLIWKKNILKYKEEACR